MKKLICLLLAMTVMLFAASAWAEPAPAETLFTPGTYQAEAQGMLSTVKVWVTVDEQEIIAVLIDATDETETLGGVAAGMLSAAIRDAQTPNVDTISGATVTSKAVIQAVTEALVAAGADIDVLDANRRDAGGDSGAKPEKTIDTSSVPPVSDSLLSICSCAILQEFRTSRQKSERDGSKCQLSRAGTNRPWSAST